MKQLLLCIALTVATIITGHAQTPALDTAAYTKAVAMLQTDLFKFFHDKALPAVRGLADSVQAMYPESQRARIKTTAPVYTQVWHQLSSMYNRLKDTMVKPGQLKVLRKQVTALEAKQKKILAGWEKSGLPASFDAFSKLAPEATNTFTEWFDSELKTMADRWFAANGSATNQSAEFWRHYATDVTRTIASYDLDEARILLWDGTVYGNDLSAYTGIPPVPPLTVH